MADCDCDESKDNSFGNADDLALARESMVLVQRSESSRQSVAIFPREIQVQILRHLDWKSLMNLRGTNCYYRGIVGECQDIWKTHHDGRWNNGKCRDTWLASRGLKCWSRTKNWMLHAEKIEDGNWFNEFLRRSRLDQSVHLKLLKLIVEHSQSNDVWYDLMVHGKDIVDCLKRIIAKERERNTSLPGRIGVCSPLQVTGEKVLMGISRCIALQEWKFLHEVKIAERVQLEDGAMAIAKFYESVDDILTHDSIHQFEEYVLYELERLANIIKNRLTARSYASVEAKHPTMDVVEEMKFLFDVTSANDEAFRGNVDDYYDPKNSLISQCLRRKTGIPITLAVIYTSIVRRVCDIQMDIIGLPGHIVVGVPFDGIHNSSRVFIDPFNGGRILSYVDCSEIVTRYNISFHPDMVTPISNEKVWQRMVGNLIHSHSMQETEDDNDDGFFFSLRFLLSDYALVITNFHELVSAPGWCLQPVPFL